MNLAINRLSVSKAPKDETKNRVSTDKAFMARVSMARASENLLKVLKLDLNRVKEVGKRLALPKRDLIAIILFKI